MEASAPRTGSAFLFDLDGVLESSAGVVTPHHLSQNVTAKDIEVGQVRIPSGATKTILPPVRQDIVVDTRGRKLTCRWDPRCGAKERSGVIRVGKAAAADLL
jgi:hypothetical protein